jgi:hypothetical protein
MRWKLEVICNRFCLGTSGIVLLLVFSGCSKTGPDLVPVSGRVTLNGKPAESTKVMFYPEGEKSPSLGRTDKDGRYMLRYKRGVEGGTIGWNIVRLETVTEVTHGRQLVPERFITGSDLRREVKPGSNTFDFELNDLDK